MPVFYPNMASKPNVAHPLVTLTSDFGLADAYVAEMKGAILQRCPLARLIDVTHLILAGDVLAGSIMLERVVASFWPGSVHLAVVDPGVGSRRRLLVVDIAGRWIVCPDNGLITWAWQRHGGGEAYELVWRPKNASDTFHGRDIMGPVAGMLAAGRKIREVAQPIDYPVLLKIAPATSSARKGRIIHIDHFGNATTNIAVEAARKDFSVRIGRRRLGKSQRAYSDVPSGEVVALFGSSGLLEIAVRDGSAAKKLSLSVGDEVTID
jgi:S-adenosyl-L-methionine hydrolase (adenosine-forming)